MEKNYPVSLADPDKVSRIRELLDYAGYTEPRILQLLGVEELPTFRQRRQGLPLYLWRTREGTTLDTLVRLFLLRQPATLVAARRAVEPMHLEDWVEVGLLSASQAEVTAAVEICPYKELVLVADWPEEDGTGLDQVMGVAASSRTLAQMTIQHHAARTLDLGTGCGVLAFLAASHSDQVVAVDRNPRAILMTQFNAQLNGLANIVCLAGNLFEPVHNQTFDLITCNPPFVIAPRQGSLHSHSGLPADQFCQTIVRLAPTFLREGGYCQLLCNWACVADRDWQERLTTWFAGTSCDAWLLHSHTEDAAGYALKRISEIVNDPRQIAKQFEEWMAYYKQEQIEAVGFGLITLRRSSRPTHWFHYDRLQEVVGSCGKAIEQGFALRDFLEATCDDEALLSTRLRHAANLRWERHHEMLTEGWSMTESRLRMTNGLTRVVNADPSVIEFVSRCKGDLRLRDYLRELAAATGQDINQFAPGFLKVVRRMVELGCLLPEQ
jgi:hypothetical protein